MAFFFWFVVAVALVALVVVFFSWSGRRRDQEWASSFSPESDDDSDVAPDRFASYSSVQAALAALAARDEDFSFVVFEDFLYALYAEVHTARGKNDLDALAPYLTGDTREQLQFSAAEVSAIVVGSMRTDEVLVDLETRVLTVKVTFTANYTETLHGAPQSYFVVEEWRLTRGADVLSRAPEKARVFGCRNCGAPLPKGFAIDCRFCNQPATGPDWKIESVQILERETRGPMLTGTTEEVGTEAPTLVAPDSKARFDELQASDPAFSWSRFSSRVEHIFATFHEAWSNQELSPMRSYLSDGLFETQRYWVETYKRAGLRNVTADRRIITIHLARVLRDKYFDAITLRVFATCLDFTVDAAGAVVGGSKTAPRNYSEYWTLIRARGVATKADAGSADTAAANGRDEDDPGCPNCGAPTAQINMAGVCGHCNAKVTMGTFDWVLSRIEQDESFSL